MTNPGGVKFENVVDSEEPFSCTCALNGVHVALCTPE